MQQSSNNRKTVLSRHASRRVLYVGAVLAVVLAISLFGFALSNRAATNYGKQRASFTASAQQQAKTAATLSIRKFFDTADAADNLTNQNAACATSQSASMAVEHLVVPHLSRGPFIAVTSFLSAKYRAAQRAQSEDEIVAQTAIMRTHLQRLAHACKVVVAENNDSLALQPYVSQQAALLTPCKTDSNGCVNDPQVLQYQALEKHVLTYAQSELAIYKNNCLYPELEAVCKQLQVYWSTAIADTTAYIQALVPGNDFDSANQKQTMDTNKNLVSACQALRVSQPTLYANARLHAAADCTDQATSLKVLNQAEELLLQTDETAIHQAAAAITAQR